MRLPWISWSVCGAVIWCRRRRWQDNPDPAGRQLPLTDGLRASCVPYRRARQTPPGRGPGGVEQALDGRQLAGEATGDAAGEATEAASLTTSSPLRPRLSCPGSEQNVM